MAALTESELPDAGRAMRWRLASDHALARGAAHGAEGAFEEIFARYQPALVRHCRAILLDADEAQDAAQNALTSALRALRRGTSDPVSLKAWLYRIAHNEAVAIAKRRSAQQAGRANDSEAALERIAVDGPADDDTRRRLADLVSDLRQLPDRQRSALLLRELSGLGYDEIAGVLGTSAGASRQTVFEARNALMDIGAGREDSCDGIRRMLSDGDRRVRRGRRVRAHVRTCAACTDFVARIDDRSADLNLLFPLGPALAVLGGGAASIAGAGAGAGGAWGIGIGASAAVKCATVCAAAALMGAAAIEHPAILLPGKDPAARGRSVALAKPAREHHAAHVTIALARAAAPVSQHSASGATSARRSTVAVVTASPSHASQTRSAHVPDLPDRAHVPAATATATATTTTAPVSHAPAPTTPAVTQSRHSYASYVPAAAREAADQAFAAAQQQAQNIVQRALASAQTQVASSLTAAQELIAQVTSGFLGTRSVSANAPVSSGTP